MPALFGGRAELKNFTRQVAQVAGHAFEHVVSIATLGIPWIDPGKQINGCQRFHVCTVCNIGGLKSSTGRCAYIVFYYMFTFAFACVFCFRMPVFVFVVGVVFMTKHDIASTHEQCNLPLDSCRGFENKPVAKHVMDFACRAPRRGGPGQLCWNKTNLDVFLSPFCIHTFSDKNGSDFLNQLEQNQFWSSFATGCRQIWTTRLNVRWNNFPKNPHLFWVLSPVQILRSYPHAMHSIQFACLFEPPKISSKKACPNLCVFNFISMFSWYKCSSTCSTTKTFLCNCSLFRFACDFGVLDFIADLIGCLNVFLRRIWFGSSQMDMLYVWGRCGLCQRHFAGHRLAFKFASVAVAAPKLLAARFAAPRTNCVWCVFAKGCFPLGCAPKSAIFCGTWEMTIKFQETP